ncbi:MAG: post-PEP-CTERM-1 domain-containing protein [Telluria sp.]
MAHAKLLMALPLAALFAAVALHAPARASDGQEGMVVVRDPQTGQLRAPTPAERKALTAGPAASLRAAAPVSSLAPQVVRNPDGSRKVKLGQRGLVFDVVTRAPDGRLTEQCVQGEDAASRAVKQPATQQQEPRHEDR